MIGEFEVIAKYFAPLAAGAPGAEGLSNDGACFTPGAGLSAVVTADAMVAGVHFLPEDPPETLGRKLLRVNLSDLAAMGARPRGYLLVAAFPDGIEEDWISAFAAGLARDQAKFGVDLLGGDTVSTPGPLTLSLTAFGEAAPGRILTRSGARAGDRVFVSGMIGDGMLGLKSLRGELMHLSAPDRAALAERYRLPAPRLALGRALSAEALATAALDVSDGLVADMGHICAASDLAAKLDAAAVPHSAAGARAIDADAGLLARSLTGGDDYELLFTVAPDRAGAVQALARDLKLPLTPIGRMVAGQGVRVFDGGGEEIALPSKGWAHF
jgi:thiamine-monophosphate kinase